MVIYSGHEHESIIVLNHNIATIQNDLFQIIKCRFSSKLNFIVQISLKQQIYGVISSNMGRNKNFKSCVSRSRH